ncbi:MAG: hypothetical protein RMJ33_14965, partial [Saprospiraceae bacterium]|nr:hypothetical protein [Saprospiraceae bacterium]
ERPRRCGQVTAQHWVEAVDADCRIVIAEGKPQGTKPYALAQLHTIGKMGNGYDRYLCGNAGTPSPVWIADFDGYQTVTVFGATVNPRRNYLDQLTKYPVWPLGSS